jgi:hypothetical protein
MSKDDEYHREAILVRLLHREGELRKAPSTLEAMAKAEESVDTEWMDVIHDIQTQIVDEFIQNNKTEHGSAEEDLSWLSVHELRLAALRHPEICFWIKYNRARDCDLVLGQKAPDVPLVDAVTGNETTLFRKKTKDIPKSTVVVAGSLS